MPFRWGDANDATPDGLTCRDEGHPGGQRRLLEYLRGDDSCEAGNTTGCILNYRVRSSKLGDFINSEPYYQKIPALGIDWVFSGANDGMLHVLNGSTGDELFAFIPFTVFGNLDELSDPGYNDIHKFYVDGYVTAKDLGDATILVGGLGKGGKGFYALNLDAAATAVAANDIEGSAQTIVKWEYNTLTQAADAAISSPISVTAIPDRRSSSPTTRLPRGCWSSATAIAAPAGMRCCSWSVSIPTVTSSGPR